MYERRRSGSGSLSQVHHATATGAACTFQALVRQLELEHERSLSTLRVENAELRAILRRQTFQSSDSSFRETVPATLPSPAGTDNLIIHRLASGGLPTTGITFADMPSLSIGESESEYADPAEVDGACAAMEKRSIDHRAASDGHARPTLQSSDRTLTRTSSAAPLRTPACLGVDGKEMTKLCHMTSFVGAIEMHRIWQESRYSVNAEGYVDKEATEAFKRIIMHVSEMRVATSALSENDGKRKGATPAFSQRAKQFGEMLFNHLYMDPTSHRRLLWDAITLFFILSDVVFVPYQAAMGLPALPFECPGPFTRVFVLFWVLDIPMNFLTGFFAQGYLVRKPRLVAKHYAFKRLPRDIALCFLDMAVVSSCARTEPNFQRLRVLRLVRVWQMPGIIAKFTDVLAVRGYDVLLHVFAIANTLAGLVIMGHAFGCAWYYMGASAVADGETTWMEALDYEEPSVPFDTKLHKYAVSAHWILGHMTGAPVADTLGPRNNQERIFTVFVMLCQLMVLGYGVAVVTSTLEELGKLNSEFDQTRRQLQRFLHNSSVPSELSLRVVRFVMDTIRRRRSTELKPHVQDMLSATLLTEITVCQRRKTLEINPLLSLLKSHTHIFNTICTAVSVHRYGEAGVVFAMRSPATSMYVTAKGTFALEQLTGETRSVEHHEWFTEVALFSQYAHRATLTAVSFSECYALNREDLHNCVRQDPASFLAVFTYGKNLLGSLWELEENMPANRIMVNDSLPTELSIQAKQAVREITRPKSVASSSGFARRASMSSTSLGNEPLILPPFHPRETLDAFMMRALHGEEPATELMDEFPDVFGELHGVLGPFAVGRLLNEVKRSICAMLSVISLVKDRYEDFTAAQSEERKMTRTQWQEMQRFVKWTHLNEETLCAMLVFLAIRGIGKVKPLVNQLPPEQRTPEKAVLYVIETLPELVPSFQLLNSNMKELVKNSLLLHNSFKFPQLLQGENLPYHLARLQAVQGASPHGGDKVLKFYLLALVAIMAALKGVQSPSSALFMDSSQAVRTLGAIKCLQQLGTASPHSIYWSYISAHATHCGMPTSTAEDLVLARLCLLFRADTHDECSQIAQDWHALPSQAKEILARHFLADGISRRAFMLKFLPDYFVSAKQNPEVGVYSSLCVLCDLLELLQMETHAGAMCIKVDFSDVAKFVEDTRNAQTFDMCAERMTVSCIGSAEMQLQFITGSENRFEYRLAQVSHMVKRVKRSTLPMSPTYAEVARAVPRVELHV